MTYTPMTWKSLTLTGKLVAAAIAIALLVAAFFAVRALFVGGLETEVKLGKNTTQAAQQSGADAVNVAGKAGEREAAIAETTRTNEEDIRNAEGADAPVAEPVKNAGIKALCRRAAYADDPRCVGLRN